MSQEQHSERDLLARRRLLKAAVYVPPAILGVMVSGSTPAQSAVVGGITVPISATSNVCGPCANVLAAEAAGTPPLPQDIIDCLKKQCTKNCINCGVFVANPQLWGKTTCEKCTKVYKQGCALQIGRASCRERVCLYV